MTGMSKLTGPLILALLPLAVALATDNPDSAATRGPGLLQPFKQSLKTALQQGLAAGPVAAIDACRVEAPELAARLSRDGVRMGRASHRLRNAANRGPAWVTPLLERYSTEPAQAESVVISLGIERVGYVEPIYLQTQCLACHGKSLAPAVATQLQALYPNDQATGFEAGEFRGVFWVEFPLDP